MKSLSPLGVSNVKTVLNLIMSVIGIGVLALPKGIAEGGYALSIFMFLLTCSLCHISVVLLHRCISLPDPKTPLLSYQSIGNAAFGRPGHLLVSVINFLNLFTVCACMLILLGDCLAVFTPSLSTFVRISIASVSVLPLALLPSLKEIAAVSMLGVAAVLLTCVAVVAFCARHIVDATEPATIAPWPQRPMAVGISFANFMNSYTVAPVVPTIVASMRHPHQFPKISFIAFIAVSVVFGVIGFSGYLAYGEGIRRYSSVGDAINRAASQDGTADALVKTLNVAVQIGILIVCLSHFVSLFNPVALAAEGFFLHLFRAVSLPERVVIRTVVVSGCYGLAAGVNNFNSLVNLLGATFVMLLQIIFPFAFHEAIARRYAPEKALGIWVTGGVVGLGCLGMVVGTYEAVASFNI